MHSEILPIQGISIHINIIVLFNICFYLPFQGGTSFVDSICFCCLVFTMLLCTSVYTLWSPAGKGLTSWLSFVVSNCEFVSFPLVSWVRCGT